MAFASPTSRQRKGELKGAAAAASPLSSSPSRTALSAHQHYVSTHNVRQDQKKITGVISLEGV